jgi:guanylate kinase
MNSSAQLYIISAPSGAGKTSLVNALVASVNNVTVSVSATTRERRPDEVDGVNYQFISMDQFQRMIEENLFLEHAQVFDHYYGTSKEWVMSHLREGIDVILEIDWQGARQVRGKFPEAISIYILPPSYQALEERLIKRGQDGPDTIRARMDEAVFEMAHFSEYQYVIINDDFESAVADLRSILRARRLTVDAQRSTKAEQLALILNPPPGRSDR